MIVHGDAVGEWVSARVGAKWYGQGQALGRVKDGQIICGVIVENYNGASAAMHVAGIGNWLNREFLHFVFDYVFRQLGLVVVYGSVSSDNEAAQRFDEHLGFKETGRIKNGCPGGDMIIYTMRREDCRYWRKS